MSQKLQIWWKGGRREARFPRTPLATLDKLASKKDQEFPGKISLQLAIFPSVFDEKVCLISLKPFDRVACHKKVNISNYKIPRKLYWNGQGLQQVVEKGDKLSNFCDEIGGNGFLERTRFLFSWWSGWSGCNRGHLCFTTVRQFLTCS